MQKWSRNLCQLSLFIPMRTQSQNRQKWARDILGNVIWNSFRIYVSKGEQTISSSIRKKQLNDLFSISKDYHNLRYTREKDKSKIEDLVRLTLVWLNLKKSVKMIVRETFILFKWGNKIEKYQFFSKNV